MWGTYVEIRFPNKSGHNLEGGRIRCMKFVTFSAKMLKVMVQPFAVRLASPFKQRPFVTNNSMRKQSPEEGE